MRFALLLLFIVSISSKLRKTLEPIELDLLKFKEKLFLPIEVGEPRQRFHVLFDTATFHFWLGNNTLEKKLPRVFRTKRSKTYEEIEGDEVIGTNQKGREVADIIALGEDKIVSERKFHFLLLNVLDSNPGMEGVLGMSRDYQGKFKYNSKRTVDSNPKFNLLQFLYINRFIDKKQFAIKFVANDKANLILGGAGTSKSYPTCTPNEVEKNTGFYHNWNCPYSGIMSPNGTYIYNFNKSHQTVHFETALSNLQLPLNQAKLIFEDLKIHTKGNCKTTKTSRSITGLFCVKGSFDPKKVPDYILKIDGFDFRITGKEIFEPYYLNEGKGIYGYITRIVGDKGSKKLLRIGHPFLKYYHLVFDQEEGSVGFVEYIDVFSEGNNFFRWHRPRRGFSVLEIVAILLIIGLVCGFGYLMYRRRKLKKKIITHSNDKLIEPIGKPMISK